MDEIEEKIGSLSIEDFYAFTSLHLTGLFRIYDLLLVLIAADVSSDRAKDIQRIHEEGKFLFPPPFPIEEE